MSGRMRSNTSEIHISYFNAQFWKAFEHVEVLGGVIHNSDSLEIRVVFQQSPHPSIECSSIKRIEKIVDRSGKRQIFNSVATGHLHLRVASQTMFCLFCIFRVQLDTNYLVRGEND